MTNLYQSASNRPYHAVATLIERHGLWRVLRAMLAAVLRRRAAPGRVRAPEGLSNHLLRDIGLSAHAPGPRHWPPPF